MVNSDGFDVSFGGMSMRGIILSSYAVVRLKTLIFNIIQKALDADCAWCFCVMDAAIAVPAVLVAYLH